MLVAKKPHMTLELIGFYSLTRMVWRDTKVMVRINNNLILGVVIEVFYGFLLNTSLVRFTMFLE